MKRAAAFIMALLIAFSMCACGGETGTFRTLEVIDRRDYALMCRSGDKLAPVVDAALNVLSADGTLSYICQQWLHTDLIISEGDAAALAPYAEDLEPRSLIVGVDEHFNPLSFAEGDGMSGLFADVAMAIGRLLNWEIRLQPIARNDLAAQLSSGNIDCAVGFDTRLVSAERYYISEPFLRSDIVLAVKSDSGIKKVSQIDGHRIGSVADSVIANLVNQNEKLMKYSSGVTAYVSSRQCIKALDKGWCHAVALDSIMLAYYEYN